MATEQEPVPSCSGAKPPEKMTLKVWDGQKTRGKLMTVLGFQDLLDKEAVNQTRHGRTGKPALTDYDIETQIKDWFRNASDRDDCRKRRHNIPLKAAV